MKFIELGMMNMDDLSTLTTEKRNKNSFNIDNMSTSDILTLINNEDMSVAESVKAILPEIEKTVNIVSESFKKGGKLFYIGAGTSGRIGILDAVECPPTFSTPPELVQGIMAGGIEAIEKAVEGAEDSVSIGAFDLKKRHLSKLDVVIGIAASGRTPYVIGALKYARKIGASTVSLSSNEGSIISNYADIKLEVLTGPEVITGSTRLKAATAHKMILNMITSASMIKIGKVYENLMVDLSVSNIKLKERAVNIVSTITNVSYEEAERYLVLSNFEVKPAIVMVETNSTLTEAKQYLSEADGFVRKARIMALKER